MGDVVDGVCHGAGAEGRRKTRNGCRMANTRAVVGIVGRRTVFRIDLHKVIDKALNMDGLDVLHFLVSKIRYQQSVDYPVIELQGQRGHPHLCDLHILRDEILELDALIDYDLSGVSLFLKEHRQAIDLFLDLLDTHSGFRYIVFDVGLHSSAVTLHTLIHSDAV